MKTRIKNFVPNQEDNLHCFQACFIMAYEYFTGRHLSIKDAENMTNFVPGKPTWQYKGMLSLAEHGLFVMDIESFRVDKFIDYPEKVIKEHVMDENVSNFIFQTTNLPQEQLLASYCLQHPNIVFRYKVPSISDISTLISLGCLIIVNVNYWSLLGKDDYYGHFVIVDDVNDDHVLLQNPGLPPIQNQKITHENFLRAWHYPNKNMSNIIAVNEVAFHNKYE